MRFYQILREVQSHFSLRLICLSHGNHTRLEVIYYGRSILQLRLRLRGRLPPGRKSEQLGLLDSGAVLPLRAPPGRHFDDRHQAGRRREEEGPPPLLHAAGAGAHGRPHRANGRTARAGVPLRHGAGPQQPSVQDVCQGKEADHRGRRALRRLWLRLHQLRVWKSVDASRHRLVSGRIGPHLRGCAPSAAIWP